VTKTRVPYQEQAALLRSRRESLIARTREEFASYGRMSPGVLAAVEATRLLPIAETIDLFERAMDGDLIFPAEEL
jgi:hypothetical protein